MVNTQTKEKTAVAAKTIDWGSIGVLWFSTLAASGLISAYVLALAWFNIDNVEADPLEKAGEIAVRNLTATTVFDPAFGSIGIQDRASAPSASGASKIRSINTVFSLLRQAAIIGQEYDLPAMGKQTSADLALARKLEVKLKGLLNAQVVVGGPTYLQIKNSLAHSARSGRHLTALSLELGVVDLAGQTYSTTAISAGVDENKQAYVRAGKILALAPVPVPQSEPLIFHQQADATTLVASEKFSPAAPEQLPTAILITADYETSTGKNRAKLQSRRRICLLCGNNTFRFAKSPGKARPVTNKSEPTCMILTFPQGRPQLFNCLADLFNNREFKGHGEWQQTNQGTVPGNGSLAPPVAPVLVDMNGRDSLSIAFYHWLRQLNEPVSPGRLTAVINSPWPKLEPRRKNVVSQADGVNNNDNDENTGWQTSINSCLVSDTDARALAFLHQTGPQEAGQKALRNCFSDQAIAYPSSALPLIVDGKGDAFTPGRTKFERVLTTDLLTEIYGTNLAAQDTIATAHLVELAAHKAFRDTRDRIVLKQADLSSMKDSMRKETQAAKDKILKGDIAALETSLEYEQAEQKRLAIVLSFAHTARANAMSAARQSFDLSNRLMEVCRSGIYRMDSATLSGAFLLGKRFIFSPHLVALSEAEIFEQADLEVDKSGSGKLAKSGWLQDKLLVFGRVHDFTKLPDTQIFAEGRPISDLLAEELPVLPAAPVTIVYDSRALLVKGVETTVKFAGPQSFSDYPFKGLPVSEKQLLFYAQKAFSTNIVSWSVLARDYVAYREDGRGGQAIASNIRSWCHANESKDLDSECPALACEWQLRAPVVLLDDQLKKALRGATLTDPKTGQRIPQIPPVDVTLM